MYVWGVVLYKYIFMIAVQIVSRMILYCTVCIYVVHIIIIIMVKYFFVRIRIFCLRSVVGRPILRNLTAPCIEYFG